MVTRVCGRPTRQGRPCVRELLWYQLACPNHSTPLELDAALVLLRAQMKDRTR